MGAVPTAGTGDTQADRATASRDGGGEGSTPARRTASSPTARGRTLPLASPLPTGALTVPERGAARTGRATVPPCAAAGHATRRGTMAPGTLVRRRDRHFRTGR